MRKFQFIILSLISVLMVTSFTVYSVKPRKGEWEFTKHQQRRHGKFLEAEQKNLHKESGVRIDFKSSTSDLALIPQDLGAFQARSSFVRRQELSAASPMWRFHSPNSKILGFLILTSIVLPVTYGQEDAKDCHLGRCKEPTGNKVTELSHREDSAPAQFIPGMMYEKDHGVVKDEAEAARLYHLAEDGDAQAQYDLAAMFFKTGQRNAKAVHYYRLAADQGHVRAQYNLAVMLSWGVPGIEQDVEAAMALYHRAADQGLDQAKTILTVIEFNPWFFDKKDRVSTLKSPQEKKALF